VFSFVLLIVALFVINLYRLRFRESRKRREEPLEGIPAASLAKSIRTLQVAVVLLPVLLIVGLLQTKGEPLGPRLAGTVINVCLTLWIFTLLRRAKKIAKTKAGHQGGSD
jgi:amino acid transporter